MSAWIQHVKKTRAAHEGMSYKEAMIEAKKTYKRKPKKQKGSGLIHAQIAEATYKSPSDRKDIGKYKYISGDAEKSRFESDNEIILGFRGTVSRKDVITDAALAVGTLHTTGRYKRDKEYVKKVIAEKTGKKIILAGHSLSGAIVSSLSREFGLEVWAYNPGKSVKENIRSKIEKVACAVKPKGKRCRKVKLINTERTALDPVSLLGAHAPNTKTVKQKVINPHSIANFT